MDTVIFSPSLSPAHILPYGARCHVYIPRSQASLCIHVQHCVSSNQARTTAVPGAGITELKLCWMEVDPYKVSMGFKNGMLVSAALHINFWPVLISQSFLPQCNTLSTTSFITLLILFKVKQENQQKCEKIRFFLNLHIEDQEAEYKKDF